MSAAALAIFPSVPRQIEHGGVTAWSNVSRRLVKTLRCSATVVYLLFCRRCVFCIVLELKDDKSPSAHTARYPIFINDFWQLFTRHRRILDPPPWIPRTISILRLGFNQRPTYHLLRAVDTGIITWVVYGLAWLLIVIRFCPASLAIQESEEKLRREREPDIDRQRQTACNMKNPDVKDSQSSPRHARESKSPKKHVVSLVWS